MQTLQVQEFHDQISKWLKSKAPIVITRYGKEPVGVYYPTKAKNLPKEVSWAILEAMTDRVREHLEKKGVKEKEVLSHFEEWRKNYRVTRRRR